MVLYLEVNLLCMAVLMILLRAATRMKLKTSRAVFFIHIIVATVLMCMSDLVAGVFRGATFPGARNMLWIANILYQGTFPLAGSFWFLYSLDVLYEKTPKVIKITLMALLVLNGILMLLSPITGWFFTLDEQNLYHRGSLLPLQWVYTYALIIIPSVLALVRRKQCEHWHIVASFVIPPAICCVLQSLFYGLTTAQAGISLSMLLLYVMLQSDEIAEARMQSILMDRISRTDPLTGVLNRRAYEQALESVDPEASVGVIFCDLNNLKFTNDTLGHQAGDKLIQRFCELMGHFFPHDAFFRISGDEFVGLVLNKSEIDFCMLVKEVHCAIEQNSRIASMGSFFGYARDGVFSIVTSAEKLMYVDKKAFYQETGHDRRHYN